MQISSSKLNQIIFYKQKLSAPVDDPIQAVESLFAIQNQYPSTACQVLWGQNKKSKKRWTQCMKKQKPSGMIFLEKKN